ncbi:hypothetical protein [Bradyrhizobium sp. LVM 105]|uniref:hypothetical protein n=1 Tax=Bradyrhizobium sp. LVM 105 TaxID=2341115 RepID=UPI0013E065F7|nr:hypothetical protein [Bradyrhizobium sp. LVM 105]
MLHFRGRRFVVGNFGIVHIGAANDAQHGRIERKLIACQILISAIPCASSPTERRRHRGAWTAPIARVVAQKTVDELFPLMKPPSSD